MLRGSQIVNLVVLLFFIIVGATVEVLVNIILGALVCVIPLVVFAMFSPTSSSSPLARSLRRSPLMVLGVVVCGSGFMVMIGAGAFLDLVGLLIGLVLFIAGLVVLAPRLRSMQQAQGQPNTTLQPPAPVIPAAVYGEPTPTPPSPPPPPGPQFAPPPAQYPPSPRPSAVGPPGSTAERYCPVCGAGYAKVSSFCPNCGKPLPPSP